MRAKEYRMKGFWGGRMVWFRLILCEVYGFRMLRQGPKLGVCKSYRDYTDVRFRSKDFQVVGFRV